MAYVNKFKRSDVPGKVPTVSDLELGEVSINTYDGRMYMRINNGVNSIVEITGSGITGNPAWGLITGSISAQTDLQTALGTKQPLDGDLTAIAGLTDTFGLLKKTGANTWELDATGYASATHVHAGVYEPANANIQTHISSSSNPHNVTKAQIGLDNVNNTSDINKPVSIATQTALGLKSNVGHTHTLDELSDVVITTPVDTQILKYNGTNWVNANVTGGGGRATTLDSLTDVTITSPEAAQLLLYSGSEWINTSVSIQPLDGDLTAIAGLTGTTGLLRKTAANTWELDTASYTTNTGTVTSVSGTGTVSGLTLSGTVTSTGSLTLGGTLAVTPSNFASQTAATVLAAPNGTTGVPTFRALIAADIPTLNQNTTGSAGSTTAALTFNNSGTGDASGTTFNGGTSRTLSHNSIGASPLAGSASLTTTGTVTSGTWSGSFGAISGANLTTLNASNLSTGTVGTSRLGTGTANSTTFLRGDGTWATPAGGGAAITVKDEGTNLTTALASINFVGTGVVATTVGNDVTVTIAGGGGSATPAGTDTQVQFNDAGSFGADVGLTFNKTTNELYVQGGVTSEGPVNVNTYSATRPAVLQHNRGATTYVSNTLSTWETMRLMNDSTTVNAASGFSYLVGGQITAGVAGVRTAADTGYMDLLAASAGNWVVGARVNGNGLALPTASTGLTLNGTTGTVTAPSTGNVTIFGKTVANRVMAASVGPSGLDAIVQPAMFRQRIAYWNPPGNATTVPGVFGLSAPTGVGTATSRNWASTNLFTRTRRLGYVSAATAAALCGHYNTAGQFTTGNGAGLGGFFYSCRFGMSDVAAVAGVRAFVGLSSTVAAPTNVEPSTILNCIGIAQLSTDSTQLYLVYGGSAAQTAIGLGTDFPPMTAAGIANGVAYDLSIFSPPSSNGVVNVTVERLGTAFVYNNTITPGTPGLQTPANTTALAHRAWRCNNATLLAVGIDVLQYYIETDY